MHPEQGRVLCIRLAEFVGTDSTIEREPKVEGRNMVMILTPTNTKHD